MRLILLFFLLISGFSTFSQVSVGGRIGYGHGSYSSQGIPQQHAHFALFLEWKVTDRFFISLEPSRYEHGYLEQHTTLIKEQNTPTITGTILAEWDFDFTYMRLPVAFSYELFQPSAEQKFFVRPFFGIGYGNISDSSEEYYFRQIDSDTGRTIELFFTRDSANRNWINKDELFVQSGVKMGYIIRKDKRLFVDIHTLRGLTPVTDLEGVDNKSSAFVAAIGFLVAL